MEIFDEFDEGPLERGPAGERFSPEEFTAADLGEPSLDRVRDFESALGALNKLAERADIRHLEFDYDILLPDAGGILCLLLRQETTEAGRASGLSFWLGGLSSGPGFDSDSPGETTEADWSKLETALDVAARISLDPSAETWFRSLGRVVGEHDDPELLSNLVEELLIVCPFEVETWTAYSLEHTFADDTSIHTYSDNWPLASRDSDYEQTRVELYYPDETGRRIYRYVRFGDGRERISFRHQRRVEQRRTPADLEGQALRDFLADELRSDLFAASERSRVEQAADDHEVDRPTDGSMRIMTAAIQEAVLKLGGTNGLK